MSLMSSGGKIKNIPDEQINEVDQDGCTLLHIAAKNNKIKDAKALLKRGADVNVKDAEGRTPLYIAARAGNIKFCEALLKKKYNPQNQSSVMSLLTRQQTTDSQAMIKVLQLCISAGGDIVEKDEDHNTPLHHAAAKGSTETIQFLLEKRGDPNALNSDKNSPLHIAVTNNRIDVVSLLLAASCCLETANNFGQTPLELAKIADNQTVVDMLKEAKTTNTRTVETKVIELPKPLPVRFGHTSVIYQGNVFIIGGCDNKEFSRASVYYYDVIEVNPKDNTVTSHSCNLRREIAGFSAAVIGKLVYISGGVDKKSQKSKDLWSLDLSTFEWKQLQTIPYQIPLDFHGSAPASRIEILFLGCSKGKEEFNSLYNYDIVSSEWKKSESDGILYPPYREKYSCTRVRNSVYIFGGVNAQGQFLNDLWVFDQQLLTWKEQVCPGVMPSPRCSHSATCVGNNFFVSGGIGKFDSDQEDIAYCLDVAKNIWYPYTITGSGVGKRLYSGFLLGSRTQIMFIYGGCSSIDLLTGTIERDEIPPSSMAARAIAESTKSSRDSSGGKTAGLSSRLRSLKVSNSGARVRHSTKRRSIGNSAGAAAAGIGNSNSLSTSSDEKPREKRSYTSLMEHVEELEEYTNTISTDGLHFVNLLLQYQPGTSSKDDLLLLKSMCEELSIFCASKPAMITDLAKKQRELEKQQKLSRFEKQNFPYQYYQAINVLHEYNHPLPDGFESWGKTEKARYHIFNEIIQTETLYVHDLAVIIGLYMKPLQNEYKDLVSSYEFGSLFKNTESLLELNKKLLLLLEEEQKKPCKQQDAGAAFFECLDEIRSKYITYSANQIAANETFVNLSKSSPDFVTFCTLVSSLPESKSMGLNSYLIKPFQRVCRYSLLLKELDKQTPNSWPKAGNIHKAKKAIDVVVAKANESKREADSLVQVLEIQNRFDFAEQQQLQLHKLTFLKEGTLKILVKKKAKQICIFLFKEKLILTTNAGKKLTKLRDMDTTCVIIYDIEDAKPLKNVFTIVDVSDNFKIDVAAASPELKKEWIDSINNADPTE